MQEVSVIIPNFNGKHYLEICLEALASQTVGWFSVYVVDNGSTDGSVEWLKAKHPLVQVIALEKNFGFCRAVNEGIKA
ncbi:MAG TPA: glycosyltransferase, partial [Candidatus Blautia gallistercoris]|nr:glycosyltransferase [Candidatus Blautia gallistercoris]